MTQPQSLRDYLVAGRFKPTLPETVTPRPTPLRATIVPRFHVLVVHWMPSSRAEARPDLGGTGCDITETAWRPNGRLVRPQPAVDLFVLNFTGDGPIDSSAYAAVKRLWPDMPLIVMASGDSHVDRVIALELGADDFVSKPVHPRELGARIRAVLKRGPSATVGAGRFIAFGKMQLDLVDRIATTDHRMTKLCNVEFHVLKTLIEAEGRPVGRQTLARCTEIESGEADIGGEERDVRAVDVVVSRMRKKLDAPGWDSCIRTVRGFGYRL